MILKRKYTIVLTLTVLVTIVIINSCKKKEELPPNPYDNVDYGNNNPTDTTNPASFTGIHKNIFSVRCAMPGCHDGNFEPDFRTVQSAYATLVYHPVVKKLSPWIFRVVPYDTANSWFWQRINHPLIVSGTDTCQGQMPLYAPALSSVELGRISTWIMNGARDMFGQSAVFPNTEPKIIYYAPVDNITYQAIDTNRGSVFYNPFKVDSGYTFKIAVALEDDSTAVSAFINNKLKLSVSRNDYSGAVVNSSGFYLSAAGLKLWLFNVSAIGFPKGDTVFFRYYTNDGDHPNDTEYPRTDMIDPYKTWWSFIVNP